jgi:hypothetical protein
MDILQSYFLEASYGHLADEAEMLAATLEPATRPWGLAQIYRGIGLMYRSEPDYVTAAQVLDAVIAANLEDSKKDDHVPTHALYWRADLAVRQKDLPAARALFLTIKNQMPDGKSKKRALIRFGSLDKVESAAKSEAVDGSEMIAQ